MESPIPAIHGRPLFEIIDAERDDPGASWEHGRAARWIPGVGWCFPPDGDKAKRRAGK